MTDSVRLLSNEEVMLLAEEFHTEPTNICRVCGQKILTMTFKMTSACCMLHYKILYGDTRLPMAYAPKRRNLKVIATDALEKAIQTADANNRSFGRAGEDITDLVYIIEIDDDDEVSELD